MSTRTRILGGLVAALTMTILIFASDRAEANYEYDCGPHRNSMCHNEPRADDQCYQNSCYGRCGPGCSWTALGNQYTSACTTHDSCIKTRRCTYGDSQWASHSNCAGSLPAAVGSFFQTHWNNGFQWAIDAYSGLRSKVKGCCN